MWEWVEGRGGTPSRPVTVFLENGRFVINKIFEVFFHKLVHIRVVNVAVQVYKSVSEFGR